MEMEEGMGMGGYPMNEADMDYEDFIAYDHSYILLKMGFLVDDLDAVDLEDFEERIRNAFSQYGFITSHLYVEITDDPEQFEAIYENGTNRLDGRILRIITCNDHTGEFDEFEWTMAYYDDDNVWQLVDYPIE